MFSNSGSTSESVSGAAGAEQLRAQHPRPRLERAVEADAEPVGLGQLLDVHDVGERRAGHPVGAVGGREGVAVALEQLAAALLAELLDERLLEVVGPRARGGHQHHLDLARRRSPAPRRAPRRPRSGAARARTRTRASCSRSLAAPVAVRRIASMRRRFSVLKRSRGTNTSSEKKRPNGSRRANRRSRWRSPRWRIPIAIVEQLVVRDLEQLVARVGVEDLEQRLLVVAAGREGGALEHRVDLAAQDRDLGRARVVGGVRVEAEEAPLADHAHRRSAYADVVEVRRRGARSSASWPCVSVIR